MTHATESKTAIRKRILQARDAIDSPERHEKNARIRDLLLDLDAYKNAGTILCYVSFRSEVDTLRLLRLSLESGKTVVLPKVDPAEKTLSLYAIKDLNDLVSGHWGIPEPGILKNRGVEPGDVDLVVLPGVAFDRSGNRIGYGGGYYDRLLSTMSPGVPTVALAYCEQMVERIPSLPHDRPVQFIVTDSGVLQCT